MHRHNLLRSHRPRERTLCPQFRRCNQIDCKQRMLSGLSRKCQNPVESTILEEDIPVSLRTQDEPS